MLFIFDAGKFKFSIINTISVFESRYSELGLNKIQPLV